MADILLERASSGGGTSTCLWSEDEETGDVYLEIDGTRVIEIDSSGNIKAKGRYLKLR